MKKKFLLALCLLASLNGFSQTVTFDAAAKKMTIEGLTAGTLGTIITDGSGTTDNLRGATFSTVPDTSSPTNYEGSTIQVANDDVPIETLIITGELNGADLKIIAEMGRRWISIISDGGHDVDLGGGIHTTKYIVTTTFVHCGGLKHLDLSGAKIVKDANTDNNVYLDLTGGNYNTVPFNKIYTHNGGDINSCSSYDLLTNGVSGVYSVENDNEIGDAMFVGCDMLESIILPSTTTKIGNVAFMRFMNMEEMTIPASVETIESYAFWQAFNMSTAREGVPTTIIRFEGDENKVTLEANALAQYFAPMGYFAGVESQMSQLSNYAFDPAIEDNYKAGFVKAVATPPNKYWTFSNGVDVIVPDNVKVYTCQIVNGETDIRELTDALVVDGKRTIKRNNGVLVACPDDATSNAYELVAKYNADLVGTTPATTNANDYPNNSLVPVLTKSHYEPGEYYMLYHGKWVAMASDATKVPACKALLKK